jgi:signal transduction histidine kinase
MQSVALPAAPQPRRGGFFGVVRRGQTYRNLLYLALAFPIGWIYLVVLGSLFSGLIGGSGIVGVAVVIALLLGGIWVLAWFERSLASTLLRVEFTPTSGPTPRGASYWDRVQAYLRNPVTWKSLLYLVLRVPFGILVLTLGAVLGWVTAVLLFAPAIYAGAVLYAPPGGWAGAQDSFAPNMGLYRLFAWLSISGQFDPTYVASSVALTLVGVVALLVSLHIFNGVAWGWGAFARQMLGMSIKDLQLAEARAIAQQARTRAEQAERGRRQLILDASHELRTPVATIRAHIDSLLMLEGEHLPENVRSYLGVTQREAERLSVLVDDLLMLARADADELQLDIRPVDVGRVVEEVFRAMEPLAERERQITLVREVAADLPPAYADRERLVQVLLNLVRNAITYTPDGGIVSIDVAAGPAPDTISLAVSDTGIGIPEEELEHVFERFYRTDASRARHTGGFGLGLSIARDLVQAMGGTIAAESVPSGGSRFHVTLRAVTSTFPT